MNTGFGLDVSQYDPAIGSNNGNFSLYDVCLHEITECLGRNSGINNGFNNPNTVDFFMYSAANTPNTTLGTQRYLSHDLGTTNICSFATSSDAADENGNPGSIFDASYGGYHSALSAADLKFMTLIGWGLTTAGLVAAGLSPAVQLGVGAMQFRR